MEGRFINGKISYKFKSRSSNAYLTIVSLPVVTYYSSIGLDSLVSSLFIKH